ncbi:MAG: LemA family protein [Candidatus Omnitrophica bacterium]|nr:LemA family protein [Candidatus Omnitrophota bacterium]
MSLISDSVKKLFPSELGELTPVKKRWWDKIDLKALEGRETMLVGVLMLVLVGSGIYYYNKFVDLSRFTEMEQHQIEVQMQRKRNLAINLAKMVIAYAEHERTVYEYMADKRSDDLNKNGKLIDALKRGGIAELANIKPEQMEGALSKFMAVAEAYPDLKLSENFQKLMDALVISEDRIAASRMEYNKAASVFHTAVRNFPGCMYAFVFGYKEKMFHYAAVDQDVMSTYTITYRSNANPDEIEYKPATLTPGMVQTQQINAVMNTAQ